MIKKNNLYFFIDTLIFGKLANNIAKMELVNSFSNLADINNCFFYFITNSRKSIAKLENIKNEKLVFRPIYIPFYKNVFPKNLFNFLYRVLLGNHLILINYILIFFFKKFNENDVIFIRGRKCLLACWLVSFVKKIEYSFELHSYQYGKKLIRDIFYKKFMEKAKKIVTISSFTRCNWIKEGINEDKIIVIPSGVNVKLFDSIVSRKSELKSKLGFDIKKKVICYSGSLYRYRGIEDVLYAANKNKTYNFIFIGGNKEDINYYKDYANKKYSFLYNVFYLGYKSQKEVVEYIKCSDLLLAPYSKRCPTVDHMSPIKLFEYMASKVPIIVSDLSRIRDIVTDKEVTFFEADNFRDLNRKIIDVLGNCDVSKKKTLSAYEKVKNFSWDKRAERIICFLSTKSDKREKQGL